ncbi:MAG: hydroxymethylglutaryl-CoA synthase family protein [Dehalococcoidia bacterium]|nr:hydroxymethylglutaryl-CoA synthase family protein [Dehalococcoidia bacterium]
MRGILSYGAYVPYHRLERKAIGAALGAGGGKGSRAVASYDEDTTSMGAEAARAALAAAPADSAPRALYFATAEPAYLDKTNATAIHAALGLDPAVFAVDMVGAVRSGAGALRAAIDAAQPTLAVLSDIRTGLPGSADEASGGDGAAAFLCADSPAVIAEYVGGSAVSAEFLERWRAPGDLASRVWEERFGEHVYVPLARQAWEQALKTTDLSLEHVDHLIVTGLHQRAARAVVAASGVRSEAVADDLATTLGNTGTAHAGLLLADVLDRAEPNQVIAVVLLADGATVMLLRTTEALAAYRRASTVQSQIAAGKPGLSYAKFLTWRGMLSLEPPRRPDPDRPAAPPSFRSDPWKFGFSASRCRRCGTRHLPPQRVCIHCHAVDQMDTERLADVPATIATFTIDRLAYSPSPPLVAAVVNFDGGGRFNCEMTDVDPDQVAIGQRVEMSFRRLYTAENVHNYFWKARPVRQPA